MQTRFDELSLINKHTIGKKEALMYIPRLSYTILVTSICPRMDCLNRGSHESLTVTSISPIVTAINSIITHILRLVQQSQLLQNSCICSQETVRARQTPPTK